MDIMRIDPEEEIVIPDGYLPATNADLSNRDPHLRWSLRAHKPYIFDPTYPAYVEFLAACKRDTVVLRRQLEGIVTHRRILPVTFYKKKGTGNLCRLTFLIRPPFFHSSEVTRSTEPRMHGDDSRDEFILHFDQAHHLQRVRYFNGSILSDGKVDVRRSLINFAIAADAFQLEKYYGLWDKFAGTIIDTLESMVTDYEKKMGQSFFQLK